ncbi:type I methionyl aminopeptidase [Alginatibacterium sediminis]|uniref:Methionine aminopeptidase n=1 Tax=Alginatibacterium sediminis TaxID=2164068 RepID=A0A420E7Z7_9ALTE|nr:type I methionyl aminopeptidase [Alginatibacterium sediminis]RKF15513.1 type I methionyl aminopeptidase [Alginatibacterium sediminis]
MSVVIKTQEEIEKMRIAGRLAADVLHMIKEHVKPGVSTGELDQICHDFIVNEQQAIPAPLDYHGFPKSICTSVNEVVCHGIPDNQRILIDGDIVNIDITVIKDGYHGDTSQMFLIGEVSMADKKLCRATQQALYAAIKTVKPGAKFKEIGNAIHKYLKKGNYRYSIVENFCGHGIGSQFHEEPQIMHYRDMIGGDNQSMKAGMCFTIEPMINLGKKFNSINEADGWTATTDDGKNSAQWEHTLLVTNDGVEVLTLRDDEEIPRRIRNL